MERQTDQRDLWSILAIIKKCSNHEDDYIIVKPKYQPEMDLGYVESVTDSSIH